MADVAGGRLVVDLLKAEGVRYIFGIVGSTFLDVLDACNLDQFLSMRPHLVPLLEDSMRRRGQADDAGRPVP